MDRFLFPRWKSRERKKREIFCIHGKFIILKYFPPCCCWFIFLSFMFSIEALVGLRKEPYCEQSGFWKRTDCQWITLHSFFQLVAISQLQSPPTKKRKNIWKTFLTFYFFISLSVVIFCSLVLYIMSLFGVIKWFRTKDLFSAGNRNPSTHRRTLVTQP